MAQRKDKMIEDYLQKPIKVGDLVDVPVTLFTSYSNHPDGVMTAKVIGINGETVTVVNNDYKDKKVEVDIHKVKKVTYRVGFNPFDDQGWRNKVHSLAYSLESINHRLFRKDNQKMEGWMINDMPVKATNFNPYVIDKNGEKQYYQRGLCWTLEDKQTFIESIYKGLNCGQVIIRMHSSKEVTKKMEGGDNEICFMDVVDGKQRLNCVNDFINDVFPDRYGNYFSDLSDYAQNRFMNSQSITYSEMVEETTDEDVIEAFLNVNFTGVPQSKEHIEYVERIAELMKK